MLYSLSSCQKVSPLLLIITTIITMVNMAKSFNLLTLQYGTTSNYCGIGVAVIGCQRRRNLPTAAGNKLGYLKINSEVFNRSTVFVPYFKSIGKQCNSRTLTATANDTFSKSTYLLITTMSHQFAQCLNPLFWLNLGGSFLEKGCLW